MAIDTWMSLGLGEREQHYVLGYLYMESPVDHPLVRHKLRV